MKKLLLLVLLFFCFTAVKAQKNQTAKPGYRPSPAVVAPKAQEGKSTDNILVVAEQMPEFDGNIQEFLRRNLFYPEQALKNKIQGRVVVKFVVNQEGYVSNPIIERSVNAELDAEALRVVWLMPRWKPGMQNGKPVSVYFRIPITFSLP